MRGRRSAHRQSAAELRSIGEEMAGYRDLPMAKHDANVMSSSEADAFGKLVAVEEDLLALFRERLAEDQEMLAEVRRTR
jgi:hypothetical protein